MFSDLVLLNFSSKAPFVMILLRVETKMDGDVDDAIGDFASDGDFGFFIGFGS